MQSNHVTNTEARSLGSLVVQTERSIVDRVNGLHSAFDAAFKDKDGGHISQLVYRALWDKIKSIFEKSNPFLQPEKITSLNNIDIALSQEELEKAFDSLKSQLREITEEYFKTHKAEFSNSKLKSKLKFKTTTNSLDIEDLFKKLSADKLQLFPVLIDAFKALAVQGYLVKNLAPDNKYIRDRNALIGTHVDIYIREMDEAEKILDSNFGPGIGFLKTSAFDEVLSAAEDREALGKDAAFRDALDTKKQKIAEAMQKLFDDLKKENTLLAKYSELMLDITRYNDSYRQTQLHIQEGQIEKTELNLIQDKIALQYKSLSERMTDFLKTEGKEFEKNKKQLLSRIASVKSQLSQNNYVLNIESLGESVFTRVVAIASIDSKIKELAQTLTFIQLENSPPAIVAGSVQDVSLFMGEIVARLKKLKSNLSSALVDKEIAAYREAVKAAIPLKEKLAALCKQQTGTWNDLWTEQAVGAVEQAFSLDPFSQQLPNKEKLIKADLEELIEHTNSKIFEYEEKNKSSVSRLLNKAVIARHALVEARQRGIKLLRQIESEECQLAESAAKSKCLDSLNQYERIVQQTSLSDLRSVQLSKPENLVSLSKPIMSGSSGGRRKKDEENSGELPVILRPRQSASKNPKPGLWQRFKGFARKHPVITGALVGLGVGVVAVGVVAALVFAPYVAVPAVAAVGAAVIGKFGVLGTIGLVAGAVVAVTGAGAAAGGIASCCIELESYDVERQPLLSNGPDAEPNSDSEDEDKDKHNHDKDADILTHHSKRRGSTDTLDIITTLDGKSVGKNPSSPRTSSQLTKKTEVSAHHSNGSLLRRSGSFHEVPAVTVSINSALVNAFEKALAKKIMQEIVWKKNPVSEKFKEVFLKKIDDGERVKEIFEKNYEDIERKEAIDTCISSLMNDEQFKGKLELKDFQSSFLRDSIASYFNKRPSSVFHK